MIKEPQITLFDLSVCLSDAMDLVSPALVNHHKQVAYIASSIGAEMGLSEDSQKDLVLAGILHDIGALSLKDRLETLKFEGDISSKHAEIGYRLLSMFEPFANIASIVRFHHGVGTQRSLDSNESELPGCIESHIINCADKVSLFIDRSQQILRQTRLIMSEIALQSGKMFKPEVVKAFLSVAEKEYFWLDVVANTVYRVLRQKARSKTITLNIRQLNELALFFSYIIDFRSRFTATHSCGVAASAQMLASLIGFSSRECDLIRIAGYLHDLGKLAIPTEIIEKPGKLTDSEFDVIRSHTYHTYRILDTLNDFDTINTWGAFHHERLKGNGYPFHHTADVLSLGSRIMCVADVFTAISEDRPYRPGMSMQEASKVLLSMAQSEALDSAIVNTLLNNQDKVNEVRILAQKESLEKYRTIMGE
ncbi:MAG: HD domain-containing protein [Chitinivibrionales bacterium]|nr:HD domain-containing protein [Chitinivibrionales bacterium]